MKEWVRSETKIHYYGTKAINFKQTYQNYHTLHLMVQCVLSEHDEHDDDEYAPFMIMAHLKAIKRWFN